MNLTVTPRPARTLRELLLGMGIPVPSDCGGAGTCGKCRMQVTGASGTSTVLACQYSPDRPVRVLLDPGIGRRRAAAAQDVNPDLALAVDVGTTTVSLAAVDLRQHRVSRYRDVLNPQIVYGADVMSRIGQARAVRRAGLDEVIADFMADSGIGCRRAATAAGNTVMAHFLMGASPARLGAYPYRSGLPLRRVVSGRTTGGLKVRLLPLLGSFVGSDCTAAILASGMHRRKRLALLVDAGTNGEVVLGNSERLLCCSTAAGPAFEGATLECGSLAQPGAIRAVDLRGRRLSLETAGGEPPATICGSGVLDAVAAGVRWRQIGRSGRLARGKARFVLHRERDAEVYLSQSDVREVQLAKAAIAAGIRLLLDEWGAKTSDLEGVYLTGKFGAALRLSSAMKVGLLPQVAGTLVRQHGNLALRGAVEATLNPDRLAESERIAGRCTEVMLSGHPAFEQVFVDSMRFEPWR